jgi:hypothetical protein
VLFVTIAVVRDVDRVEGKAGDIAPSDPVIAPPVMFIRVKLTALVFVNEIPAPVDA